MPINKDNTAMHTPNTQSQVANFSKTTSKLKGNSNHNNNHNYDNNHNNDNDNDNNRGNHITSPSIKTSAKLNSNQSVLIVGGGHVGLSFALLLAHHGIASTLIEKNAYPNISPDADTHRVHYLDSRNTALSRRTVQIYQKIGLWQNLQEHACRIDAVHISEQGSFGRAKLLKEEEGVESFGQVMENAWLGRTLLLAVQAHPLIKLLDARQVVAIKQADQQVHIQHTASNQASTNNNLETSTCMADLLVACDGTNSGIRELLGIGDKRYDYQQSGIVGVVMTDKPHEHIAIERFSPAGPLAVLPLCDVNTNAHVQNMQGYRRSVVWICPKGQEQAYLQDDAYFLQTLQKAFGQAAGKFTKAGKRGSYPLTKVIAESQVSGRCVIMGNAAHTLHPVAGQGFNLCMRDADTLADMLAKQIVNEGNIGEQTLLQGYQNRRKKDQKRVEIFCDTVVKGFTHPNPIVKYARNLGLLAFDNVPMIKPLVATFAMGLKS